MAKNKEQTIEQAWEALDKLEEKVELLTDVVEERLLDKSKAVQRAPKSKIKPVEMPGDIEVSLKDKYNTQPKNSVTHHYIKNHRMFRKDAMHNVMRSKMFWIMLVLLPIIFTFIEYIFTGWGIINGIIIPTGLQKVLGDLVNWFMLMPLLLLSLLIFPTFIAMSRENNQLKRYSMNGMSRKQIYWSYIRFSVGFLIVFMFLWMGPWVYLLNLATDSIWLSDEQLLAGEHVFTNPWGIFFGMDYYELDGRNGISIYEFNWYYNMLVTWEMDDASMNTFFNGLESGQIVWSEWNPILTSTNITTLTYEQLQNYLLDMGISIQYLNVENIGFIVEGEMVDGFYFEFAGRLRFSVLKYHEGMKTILYFTMLLLVMFGINSVGFTKAMKVSSARSLMGWGIGLWLFASVVQGTSGLLYDDIYKFNAIDNALWNYVVMVLLFILKWMFLFSPVTIMMVGVSLTTGFITEPEVYELSNVALAYIDWFGGLEHPELLPDVFWNLDHFLRAAQENIYTPLIQPQNITRIFIGVSGFWAIMWTTKTWMFKSRIVSYEAAR